MAAQNSADGKPNHSSASPDITAESRPVNEMSKEAIRQPPITLMINRVSSETIQLVNAATNEIMYRLQNTGRGTFSSKPDYELFRPGPNDTLIGSVRMGKIGTGVKLPLTGAEFRGVEFFTSKSQGRLKWTATQFKQPVLTDQSQRDEGRMETSWVAKLECHHEDRKNGEQEPVCAVKLMDSSPDGCFEIRTKDAHVESGGDWHLLDELVTVSYANMEQARRNLIVGPTQAGMQTAGLGIGPGFAMKI